MHVRVLLLTVLVVLAAVPAANAAEPRLRAFRDCSSLIAYGNRHAERYARAAPVPARPLPSPVSCPGGVSR